MTVTRPEVREGAREATPENAGTRASGQPAARRPAVRASVLAGIWGFALIAIALLSTWPFDVDWELATPSAWAAFTDSWGWRTSQGNAAGNVLLLAPAGILAAVTASRARIGWRGSLFAAMATVTLGLAVGVQAAQLVLPSRDATLVDAVWNTVGFVAGAGVAVTLGRVSVGVEPLPGRLRPLPTALLMAWVAYRLAPFVPSLDLQAIKDNLKPLLDTAPPVRSVVANTAAWLAATFLLRDAMLDRRGDRWAPALILAVCAGETLIIGRDGLGLASVAGAGLALLIWFGGLAHLHRPAAWVWACLAGGIAVSGLWPFDLRDDAVQPFYWRPFLSILYGDMWHNALALTWKAFAYGALVYIGWGAWRSWLATALAGVGVTFTVEWLQRFQTAHVPEITDALLVVLAALTCRAVMGRRWDCGRANG
ncbi:hypothetical protein CKO28_13030 [Rhodovibrio sodomensis]|uniref:VanZ-like domain-containing protein n=1 Tax=Rhodovibrio sodomensis TaxID=1088 RepID=A0ABS1DER2_9PROT|nr:VanZ family protein [Rhodovibrio sodomensis]MBK1668955.1 hypothetical protein [Rhodovibrio sodomensis]